MRRSKPFIHHDPSIEDGTHDPRYGAQPTMAKKKPDTIQPPARQADKPQVTVLPAQCPTCHSTDAVVVKRVVSHPIAGTIDGRVYTSVTWRDMQCRTCGQRYRARWFDHAGDDSDK